MASAALPRRSGGARGDGGFLTRQLGPLPVWAWGLVALGGVVIGIIVLRGRNKATDTTNGTPPTPAEIDPYTGVPYAVEETIDKATGIPYYYLYPGGRSPVVEPGEPGEPEEPPEPGPYPIPEGPPGHPHPGKMPPEPVPGRRPPNPVMGPHPGGPTGPAQPVRGPAARPGRPPNPIELGHPGGPTGPAQPVRPGELPHPGGPTGPAQPYPGRPRGPISPVEGPHPGGPTGPASPYPGRPRGPASPYHRRISVRPWPEMDSSLYSIWQHNAHGIPWSQWEQEVLRSNPQIKDPNLLYPNESLIIP